MCQQHLMKTYIIMSYLVEKKLKRAGGGRYLPTPIFNAQGVDSEHASKTNMHTPQMATRPQELTTLATYELNAFK